MLYRIKGIDIRSENAAKPEMDAAEYLVDWLHKRARTPSALDYGCGKLRYTHHLAQRSKHVGIVDSEVQLTRMQQIGGDLTSVMYYARKRWPSITIQFLQDFWRKSSCYYDFILAPNVLSVIPCPKIRAKSLRAIHASLHVDGRALFVNQHTNSYFTEVRNRPTTCQHLDGWIAKSQRGAFYYGILNKESVVRLLTRYQFSIEDAWISGQSNYVLGRKD